MRLKIAVLAGDGIGPEVTRSQLDEVYHRFTELADRKKSIYHQDLLGLLRDEHVPSFTN
jgi:2-isopropylmalate synthase